MKLLRKWLSSREINYIFCSSSNNLKYSIPRWFFHFKENLTLNSNACDEASIGKKIACFTSFMQLIFKKRVINPCHDMQWKIIFDFSQWPASMTSLKQLFFITGLIWYHKKIWRSKHYEWNNLCESFKSIHVYLKHERMCINTLFSYFSISNSFDLISDVITYLWQFWARLWVSTKKSLHKNIRLESLRIYFIEIFRK